MRGTRVRQHLAAEGQGKAPFGKPERWASVISEMRLASGIVNVFAQTPARIAQDVVTLEDHTEPRYSVSEPPTLASARSSTGDVRATAGLNG